MNRQEELAFEESLSDTWADGLEIREVPLKNGTIFFSGAVFLIFGFVAFARMAAIASDAPFYEKSARRNLAQVREIPAPRGLIVDRYGEVLAENQPSFLLLLKPNEFFDNPLLEQETLGAFREILGMEADEAWQIIRDSRFGRGSGKILIAEDLTQSQLIAFKNKNLPTLTIESGSKRFYPDGSAFASLLGYTGKANQDDLDARPELSSQTLVGRGGVEAYYDAILQGTPGEISQFRNAKGEFLGNPEERQPVIGESVQLTIDAKFQKYFYNRMEQGLKALGRRRGVAIAMDPRNGEILALMSFPSFDGNVFSVAGRNEEKREILKDSDEPLFNRAVSGFYNPGSTIKPLVGIAALKEKVINPEHKIFSPGYLEVPNPYDPAHPSRFLDWRPQGWVDLSSALAQSSNVYFYAVGGGFKEISGLGVSRLTEWWKKFGLGEKTGIDLPSESKGTLPDPQIFKKREGRPWLLGDTYNVSIGQGDLLLTPLQLVNYISSLANGGVLYRPYVNADAGRREVVARVEGISKELDEVRKGMIKAVEAPLGTAHILKELPFGIAGKTGSAQVKNKKEENAFFVGYAPAGNSEEPKIAILVLIENSREGSLNALPIAKDALSWYYEHRLK